MVPQHRHLALIRVVSASCESGSDLLFVVFHWISSRVGVTDRVESARLACAIAVKDLSDLPLLLVWVRCQRRSVVGPSCSLSNAAPSEHCPLPQRIVCPWLVAGLWALGWLVVWGLSSRSSKTLAEPSLRLAELLVGLEDDVSLGL